ncbi:Uncharacterised protein [Slackia heliotrinireducens]|uniref:Uncharacterized protein n=1 Tax=Slackia heliotrinireducens (strain ATCC 29202 / DSM 20476 / NCTC 11029 / RHS 1) TaxID=471855 RepID=C7N247_SLAHD|nr:hypothetical protein [Slackia heliotrinireducens]ACV21353.1 hypothetical protein Shel_02850 [Slackia heliotrinireducens DSM 20476]VEG98787.1 Uncharacterised protein [Slackia heliotrinireducens]
MAYQHDYYRGSIVHHFGGYNQQEICANCVRWKKKGGCAARTRFASPIGHCDLFQFKKYANYRLDGHGGVEYTPEYQEYLEKKKEKSKKKAPKVKKSKLPKQKPEKKNKGPLDVLKAANLEYIDKRDVGGALWVVGGKEIGSELSKLSRYGLSFHYKKGGGKTTGGRSAWWSK